MWWNRNYAQDIIVNKRTDLWSYVCIKDVKNYKYHYVLWQWYKGLTAKTKKKNRSALQVSSREKSVQGKLYRDTNA